MVEYYLLSPVVYGEMADGTVLDLSTHPPLVHNLHVEMDRPPLDDLHEVISCYLVSERLGWRLDRAGLTGAEVVEAQIELSEQAREFYPDAPALEVLWLKVHGRARFDDFGLDEYGRLIVSQAAMNILREFRLEQCRVYDGNTPPTIEQQSKDAWEDARRLVRGQTGKVAGDTAHS
jgi:hypothetical protein